MAQFDILTGRVALQSINAKYNGEGFPNKFYYVITNRDNHKTLVIQKEMGIRKYEDSIIEGLRKIGSISAIKLYKSLLEVDMVMKDTINMMKFRGKLNPPNYTTALMYWDDTRQVLVFINRGGLNDDQ